MESKRLGLAFLVFAAAAVVGLCAIECSAQEKKKKVTAPQKEELPKSGSLADAGGFTGKAGTVASGPWGAGSYEAGGSPIAGSIVQAGNTWTLKVFNNSADRYSVNLEVVQFNVQNRAIKHDNFSYSLRGKQSIERKLVTSGLTSRCAVNLTNWKKFAASKTPEELQKEIAAKKAELENLEKESGAISANQALEPPVAGAPQ